MKPPIPQKQGNKKSGKSKASSHKVSLGKLANKKNSRLAKQGKLRQAEKNKKKKKALEQALNEVRSQQKLAQEKGEESDGQTTCMSETEDEIDDEDITFFSHLQNAKQFAHAQLGDEKQNSRNKKRKLGEMEDDGEEYEQHPRSFSSNEDSKNMKMMLPIIEKGKVIRRMVEEDDGKMQDPANDSKGKSSSVEDHHGNIFQADAVKNNPEKEKNFIASLSAAQLFAYRKTKIVENKEKMATLAHSVIEDPLSNMKQLKELRLMLGISGPGISLSVRKYVMVTLMEVFKDIVPGYKLRIPTDKEKTNKVKKETKGLWDYEASFLLSYRIYLEFLELMAKGKPIQDKTFLTKHSIRHLEMPRPNAVEFGLVALKCLCEMLTNHPHFNYRNNVVVAIVPFTNHKNEQYSATACEALSKVFMQDKLGEVTLEIVRCVGKMVKRLKYKVQPQVLETFLHLKIKEVDLSSINTKFEKMKKKEKMMKLSKRERKRLKEKEKLEKELLEVKASEDKGHVLKTHTEIIQAVFESYIRVIKLAPDSALLPAVLEGLAQFAHLINIEYFDNLFGAFNQLIESGNLTTREKLHCMLTAFTILSGQGNILTVDPTNFYRHFYAALLDVQIGTSDQSAPIVLECLETMIQKRRKQMSQHRILAFMKRLTTLSLQQSSPTAIAYLAAVRNFIHTYKYSNILFDTDVQGSGFYLPFLDDPEHCCAGSSCLWELHLLRHFYDPDVCQIAEHEIHMAPLAGEHQLANKLARKHPKELYHMLQDKDVTIGCEPFKGKKAKKIKRCQLQLVDEEFSSYLDQTLQGTPTAKDANVFFPSSIMKSCCHDSF